MWDPFADFGGLGGGYGRGQSSGGGNVGALRLDLYETQARPSRREASRRVGICSPRALAARGALVSAARAFGSRRGVVPSLRAPLV